VDDIGPEDGELYVLWRLGGNFVREQSPWGLDRGLRPHGLLRLNGMLEGAWLEVRLGVDHLARLKTGLRLDPPARIDVLRKLGPQPRPYGQAITRAEQRAVEPVLGNCTAQQPYELQIHRGNDEAGFRPDAHGRQQANPGNSPCQWMFANANHPEKPDWILEVLLRRILSLVLPVMRDVV
jgi:hypothetical protein